MVDERSPPSRKGTNGVYSLQSTARDEVGKQNQAELSRGTRVTASSTTYCSKHKNQKERSRPLTVGVRHGYV